MEKTAFIICEYDPFHNGHLLHINKTREAGAQNVICIMSGNFTQRGEIAFCDKRTRAQFAIDNGADLILELPLKYVISGASFFALGAAELIKALNISGTLSFGASASLEMIKNTADILSRENVAAQAEAYAMEHGASYAYSIQKVLEKTDPQSGIILNDPNNILAVEYVKALRSLNAEADYYAVERELIHNADTPDKNIASAKYIREMIRKDNDPTVCNAYMPQNVCDILKDAFSKGCLPSDKMKFSVAAMARLAFLNKEDLLEINGVNQGLENRIMQDLKNTSDIYMLYDAIKTKRFTHARIRQILLSAVLGIKKEALENQNPYIRVLGMNQRGRELLKKIHKKAALPLIMNLSEAPECDEKEWDTVSGRLFDICRPNPLHKNPEYALKPYVSE